MEILAEIKCVIIFEKYGRNLKNMLEKIKEIVEEIVEKLPSNFKKFLSTYETFDTNSPLASTTLSSLGGGRVFHRNSKIPEAKPAVNAHNLFGIFISKLFSDISDYITVPQFDAQNDDNSSGAICEVPDQLMKLYNAGE